MTPTVRGAVDRARKYLKNLPHLNIIGTAVARGSEFRSAEWGSGSYQLTREDLQLILDQAVSCERPSRFGGTPEQWDAYFREVMTDEMRLRFYQWIGTQAICAAMYDLSNSISRVMPGDTGVQQMFREYADAVANGTLTYPEQLPLGLPFCDVQHHTHTHGGGRRPTCRLDSEE